MSFFVCRLCETTLEIPNADRLLHPDGWALLATPYPQLVCRGCLVLLVNSSLLEGRSTSSLPPTAQGLATPRPEILLARLFEGLSELVDAFRQRGDLSAALVATVRFHAEHAALPLRLVVRTGAHAEGGGPCLEPGPDVARQAINLAKFAMLISESASEKEGGRR